MLPMLAATTSNQLGPPKQVRPGPHILSSPIARREMQPLHAFLPDLAARLPAIAQNALNSEQAVVPLAIVLGSLSIGLVAWLDARLKSAVGRRAKTKMGAESDRACGVLDPLVLPLP